MVLGIVIGAIVLGLRAAYTADRRPRAHGHIVASPGQISDGVTTNPGRADGEQAAERTSRQDGMPGN